MNIVNGYPPNYSQIAKAFQFDPLRVVFTYGDTIYAPSGNANIPYDLRVHEETHMRQQAVIGPVEWWRRYIAEPEFRLWQEVEAYSAQHKAMSKPMREKHIRRLAGDLSGPMYGNMVSFNEAKRLIRSGIMESAALLAA